MISTNDLDREVRDLLGERAASAGAPPPFGPAGRRRVRGRQILTAAGVAVVVSLVVLPFAAVPSLLRKDDRKGQSEPTEPVTSTVYGVSITYPDDWTLLQLNDRLKMEGTETSSLFQLSNFDPLEGINKWLCPLPSGTIPKGGVILFVQELLTEVDAPSWPVDLSEGAATFDTCGRRMARWRVGQRTFEAGVIGDLDGAAYGELIEAFRSMTFEAPDDDDPPLGFYDVTVDHAYILASGRENGEPWNLLVFRYHDVGSGDDFLCVLFDASDRPDGRCEPDPVMYDLEFVLSTEEAGGTLFAFGTAPAGAARVETLTGRSLKLHPVPDGLRIYGRRIPLDAFVGRADELVADGVRLVEVRLVDSGGAVIDNRQWIEPPSVDRAPNVRAFDHAFGELWWLLDDGERIILKTREGVIHAVDERLLPSGEHLRVWTHTFTRDAEAGAGSETVVYGLSSGEGAQVTLLLTTGEVVQASVGTLEVELRGPDLIPLSHVFSVSVPGAVRGEVVAVTTGCLVLARVPLQPETPPPSLPSPPPEPELPCIGP